MNLILGSILVATSMATLMTKQIRQIGIMKTLGATSLRIFTMYSVMMLLVCLAALILGIPLSRWAAGELYSQIARLLNLEITNSSIPLQVPLIQVVSGILVPFITAAVPVIRGSRVSVRTALDNHGVSFPRQNKWALFLYKSNVFGDAFKLSLRNAFRQRTRLALTIGLLAAGGAMFMTALNVSDAWEINLKRIYTQRLYDQEIRFNEILAADSIDNILCKIAGVRLVEGWDVTPSSIVQESKYEIAKTYPDKGHGSFSLLALPVPTQLLNPTIIEGHWLSKVRSNEVVLNQLARTSGMKIGDEVDLAINGQPTRWRIVGFVEDVGSPATAYVSVSTLAKISGTGGKVNSVRVAYSDRSREHARTKSKEIDDLLEQNNIAISASIPVWLLHSAVAAHMKVLVNSLLAMAILMALVGTLGLTSTMSINVLERTREIGVMRAIGATAAKINAVIVGEGIIVGVLSIVLSFMLGVILSYLMGEFIGHISFKTPLRLTISLEGLAIWISIVIVGAYLASLFPARRAKRTSTHKALAYE
jgi:putative ABC transport system permease protein